MPKPGKATKRDGYSNIGRHQAPTDLGSFKHLRGSFEDENVLPKGSTIPRNDIPETPRIDSVN